MINKKGPVVMDWSPDGKALEVIRALDEILKQAALHVKESIENHRPDSDEDTAMIAVAMLVVHTRVLMSDIMNRGLDLVSKDTADIFEKRKLGVTVTVIESEDETRARKWIEACIARLTTT